MQRRKRKYAALLALTAGAAGLFYATRSGAEEPSDAEFAAVERAPIALVSMQADTPQSLVAATGWPFQQLPLVAKFALPVPRLGLVPVPPPPFAQVVVPRPPRLQAPPVAPGELTPPWWVAPLAAGAFVGGSSALATTVIPEPATLVLLATGIALVGVGARRRRRR